MWGRFLQNAFETRIQPETIINKDQWNIDKMGKIKRNGMDNGLKLKTWQQTKYHRVEEGRRDGKNGGGEEIWPNQWRKSISQTFCYTFLTSSDI